MVAALLVLGPPRRYCRVNHATIAWMVGLPDCPSWLAAAMQEARKIREAGEDVKGAC